ncbi:MAG: dihydrolipoyl dehydrogenase [Desulfobacterales bacterium]|nr:dihydrolipoyl dehydrogenase [Desulfobacterales bacterium]
MVVGEFTQETDLLVIGAGPGGYAAAFRAADLGMDVILVDIAERPGGVCLYRGCIPSKTYLHLAEVIHDARRSAEMGVTFGEPRVDLAALRAWKQKVIDRMAAGLVTLSDKRGIQYIQGRALFEDDRHVRIKGREALRVKFRHAIIAAGSRATALPGIPFGKGGRIMSSTGALSLPDIPKDLLVVGGGYVGLELGMVYAALGSRITLVELGDRLLPGVDRDLVAPLGKRLQTAFAAQHLNTRIDRIAEAGDQVAVTLEHEGDTKPLTVDRVLVAIGRQPNSGELGLENTGVRLDARGHVTVDVHQRTSVAHIYAIGDIAGGVMLAHKAMVEGKIAAEVIAGQPSAFDVRAIPAVVYTDPQIAWAGLSEEDARRQGIGVAVERFPWKFSGRAATTGTAQGLTKMIVDPATRRVLGVGITGRGAEGLIAEGVLAIEMGALAEDVALSIHAHPTLAETEGEAAEMFLGAATHILPRG